MLPLLPQGGPPGGSPSMSPRLWFQKRSPSSRHPQGTGSHAVHALVLPCFDIPARALPWLGPGLASSQLVYTCTPCLCCCRCFERASLPMVDKEVRGNLKSRVVWLGFQVLDLSVQAQRAETRWDSPTTPSLHQPASSACFPDPWLRRRSARGCCPLWSWAEGPPGRRSWRRWV